MERKYVKPLKSFLSFNREDRETVWKTEIAAPDFPSFMEALYE